MTHRINPDLQSGHRVDVMVVGCGGTGSAVASGLPYLDQALRAWGHAGISVTLIDGDSVSETNCVRQPFSRSEIGLNKAVVLASRTNCFWGTDWAATPSHLTAGLNRRCPDIVIGCVDSRSARAEIASYCAGQPSPRYWLDLGNTSSGGQFVLGEPLRNWSLFGKPKRLPCVNVLFPEICNPALDGNDGPSCSAVEALDRQEPFVNQVLANHALAMLARLFRYGEIEHHGGFVSIEVGACTPMPVDPAYWKSQIRRAA